MNEAHYKRVKAIELCLFFCVCFIAAANIPILNCPDEAMRYPVAQYIFEYGTLPTGMEEELVNDLWGFSYAIYPYLTSIISAFFMKLISIFINTEASLLLAARMTSVFAGVGTLFICFKIGDRLFKKKEYSLLFGTFVAFLPQFVFLCSYQNNDSFAVFTGALIIYFWIRGIQTDWDLKTVIGIGISCGLCMLSYYNAYVYLLCSVILYFMHRIINKDNALSIFKGTVIILVLAFVIAGWFFIRNASIHNGDFLGLHTTSVSAELYAADGYKPSELVTPASEGFSFFETFFKSNSLCETPWIFRVVCSFIGSFAYLTVWLPLSLYALYLLVFAIGFIGLIIGIITKWKSVMIDRYLIITFPVLIVVNIVLVMYNAYFSDYQSQGRYLMPSMIPLMIFIAGGLRYIINSAAKNYAVKRNSSPAISSRKAEFISNSAAIILIILYLILFFVSYAGFMMPGCMVET